MTMEAVIRGKLEAALHPLRLDVVNESHNHGGPATESHFKLTVVADAFAELNRVKRHQKIYQLLGEELQGSVHALALHLYAPSEWVESSSQAPDSPDCRGGSKA